MRLAVVTLFPELLDTFLSTGFVHRAQELGVLQVERHWLREQGVGRHRSVDDTPYGGGAGMLLRVDCVVSAIEAAEAQVGGRSQRVLLSPQGAPFNQHQAHCLAAQPRLTLICGRYEGFDDRVRQFVDTEISLGDFVLNGGEVAAMAVIEACARLLPGVLGNAASLGEESFADPAHPALEYPQFTRPVAYRGLTVPELLRSGDHRKIAAWRSVRAQERTQERRPELLRKSPSDA